MLMKNTRILTILDFGMIREGIMNKQKLKQVIEYLIWYIAKIDDEHIIKIINGLSKDFSYKELQELGLESEDE